MREAGPTRAGRAAPAALVALAVAAAGIVSARLPAADDADAGGAEARAERLLQVVESQVKESAAPAGSSLLEGVDPRRAPAEVRKAAATLRRTRIDLHLEKEPVEEALDLLHQVSGLPFVLSAKARQALAAEKAELTLHLRDLPLENCLNLLALQLGDYRFVIRYGAVMLIRGEEYRPRRVLVVYEVSDIVRSRPDFPAPKLGLGVEGE